MSWLELDDRILEHPKFVRAANRGGSEAIHLWLGLRAYCGQLLTDGEIPGDMIAEVRGPKHPIRRESALNVLVEVGLVERTEDGLRLHDFLDWSMSRGQVLSRRDAAARRKRRERGTGEEQKAESRRDGAGTVTGVTNPRARVSSPLLSTPLHSEGDPEAPPITTDPLTAAGLIHVISTAVDKAHPELGLYVAGHWAQKSARAFVEAIPAEQRTASTREEIRRRAEAFATSADKCITKGKWLVEDFCEAYNELAPRAVARDPVIDAATARSGGRPFLPPEKGESRGAG